MMNQELFHFYRAWNRRTMLISAAIGVIVVCLSLAIGYKKEFLLFTMPVLSMYFFIISRLFLVNKKQVFDYLHNHYPELQYSLALTNQEEKDLPFLGKIQRQRVESQLEKIVLRKPSPAKMLILLIVGSVVFMLTGAFHLYKVNHSTQPVLLQQTSETEETTPIVMGHDSAYIEDLRARIMPPEYTQIAPFYDNDLQLEVPEGSEVIWNYTVKGPVKEVVFLFGELEDANSPVNGVHSRTFSDSEFYSVAVKDSSENILKSDYFPVKVMEDERPEIEISGIPEYQRLKWQEDFSFDFKVDLQDEYGLEDAFIIATVATGSGESVKFRERKLSLNNFSIGQKKYLGKVKLSTAEFNMEPGSELYFYVIAKDNCPFRIQASKSKTHFLILEDTVQYAAFSDGGMQVDLMPDFFRSQRQIIIDTEKLISEKNSITKQEFNQRSNELGFDQKMLRLKYGQFLGEEAESGIALENEIEEEDHSGHNHDHEEGENENEKLLNQYGHNHDHGGEEDIPPVGKEIVKDPGRPEWMEELMHNHDDAEVNTFHDIPLRAKLKAALNVMWDAELYLRLYEPQNSLPFQYEALKLLDEIKNHARVYVHRIGFDPPVIKEQEKRLTGKLEDIASPTNNYQIEVANAFENVKLLIKDLEVSESEGLVSLNVTQKAMLEKAGRELALYAIEDLSLLPILNIIRAIIESENEVQFSMLNRLRQELLAALPKETPQTKNIHTNQHPLNKKVVAALEETE